MEVQFQKPKEWRWLIDYNWKKKSCKIINSISLLLTLQFCNNGIFYNLEAWVMKTLQSPPVLSFHLIKIIPTQNWRVHFSMLPSVFPLKNNVNTLVLLCLDLLSIIMYFVRCISVCNSCPSVSPSICYYFVRKELALIAASFAHILFITLSAGTCVQLINLNISLLFWLVFAFSLPSNYSLLIFCYLLLTVAGYISTTINDGPGCLMLRCPDPSCRAAVGQDMINLLAPGGDKEKYSRYLLRSYIEDNRKVCPWYGTSISCFCICYNSLFEVFTYCELGHPFFHQISGLKFGENYNTLLFNSFCPPFPVHELPIILTTFMVLCGLCNCLVYLAREGS